MFVTVLAPLPLPEIVRIGCMTSSARNGTVKQSRAEIAARVKRDAWNAKRET